VSSESEIKVPHVYKALGVILSNLSVEKNGTLPQNMGARPYITAVDLNLEIKRQFVENGLIILPSEHIHEYKEIVGSTGKVTILIVIEGTYEIVSTVDSTSVTVSGVGDGLAQGSAVASNIASTNALKNALLRTFLVTEQSVDEASKQEVVTGPPVAEKPTALADAQKTLDGLKIEIANLLVKNGTVASTDDGAGIKAAGDTFFDGRPGWSNAEPALVKWRDALVGA